MKKTINPETLTAVKKREQLFIRQGNRLSSYKCNKLIFFIILVISIILRIIFLDRVPEGINVDEAGMAYDAYCYANYGVDRYLYHNPIYLINFGAGQSVLYMYLASIFIKILGFNIISIRLPAVILGIIAIIFAYLLGKKAKGERFGLLLMALVAICPWHIMQSRWGLDCNLMSATVFVGIYMLIISKKWWQHILTGIIFGISLYSYALSHIVVPVLLIIITIYNIYTKKIKIRNAVLVAIPIMIMAIPLILFHLVNMEIIPKISDELIAISKIPRYRLGEINIVNIFKSFMYPQNILLELFGFDGNDYNAFPMFGTIYYISIPFTILGFYLGIKSIYLSIKNRKYSIDAVITISFIVMYLCIKTVFCVSINRTNAIYLLLLYFTALGIVKIVKSKGKTIFNVIICSYAICSVLFIYYYFGIYGKNNPNMSFNNDIIQLTQYLEKYEGKRIDIVSYAVQPYIYTLIANEESPYTFNETKHYPNNTRGDYGKYYYNYDKIHDDMVYAIKYPERKNTAFENKLYENGFKTEEYLGYKIFYK